METYNLKTNEFEPFIHKIRDANGGLVMSLIVSPSYLDWMSNIKVEEFKDDHQEFYLYGWYNKFSFPVYVDKTLVECMYLIGNTKTTKIKVTDGQ